MASCAALLSEPLTAGTVEAVGTASAAGLERDDDDVWRSGCAVGTSRLVAYGSGGCDMEGSAVLGASAAVLVSAGAEGPMLVGSEGLGCVAA